MLDFIHIGLGKCMSTFMQRLWYQDPLYTTYRGQEIAAEISKNVIAKINSRNSAEDQLYGIKFPDKKSEVSCLTSETFSFVLADEFCLAEHFELRHRSMASALSGQSRRVFILVRDPLDWIKSAHAQHINQGGYLNRSDFLQKYEETIIGNLNLQSIIDIWSHFNFEPVCMSVESFKRDRSKFWLEYERLLGVVAPTKENQNVHITNDNVTNYEALATQASVNHVLNMLEVTMDPLFFSSQAEMDLIKERLDYTKRWAARRALQMPGKEHLTAFEGQLKIPNKIEFNQFVINKCLADFIENSFCKPLQKMEHMKLSAEGYSKKLQSEAIGAS